MTEKNKKFQSVCVFGLGYIGLPTASLLATRGFEVLGVDISQDVVSTINQGRIHIVEPDLDVLVRSAVQSGQLKAGLEPAPADVFILAVPTPFKEGKLPNLSYVETAARTMAPFIKPSNLIILESTSPVGTTERVAEIIFELRPELEGKIFLAHCPERVLPGQIIKELVDNDRIVGGLDPASTEKAAAFYHQFVVGKVLTTNARTAEMAKLAENTFRDVNISLANELSIICDELDIDIWQLISLTNHHPRVNILQPGPGVGGHCIAVDPWFIISSSPDNSRLIRTARTVNDQKPDYVISKIDEIAGKMDDPIIACLGLSYKANVDDLRESPALEICEKLASSGSGQILIVDPYCNGLPVSLQKDHVQLVNLDEALKQADLVVALVPHRDFLSIDSDNLVRIKLVDACGLVQKLMESP